MHMLLLNYGVPEQHTIYYYMALLLYGFTTIEYYMVLLQFPNIWLYYYLLLYGFTTIWLCYYLLLYGCTTIVIWIFLTIALIFKSLLLNYDVHASIELRCT